MSFDLRTEIRDPKTGKVVTHQPYVMVVRNGATFFKRDGKLYDPAGNELADEPGRPSTTQTATAAPVTTKVETKAETVTPTITKK
jgi:hypothetical protein